MIFHMARKESNECHVMRVKYRLRGPWDPEDWVPGTYVGAKTFLLMVVSRELEDESPPMAAVCKRDLPCDCVTCFEVVSTHVFNDATSCATTA